MFVVQSDFLLINWALTQETQIEKSKWIIRQSWNKIAALFRWTSHEYLWSPAHFSQLVNNTDAKLPYGNRDQRSGLYLNPAKCSSYFCNVPLAYTFSTVKIWIFLGRSFCKIFRAAFNWLESQDARLLASVGLCMQEN